MLIYYTSVDIEEGYKVLEQPTRDARMVRGRTVDRPSGWALFHHLKGQPIQCHFCGCTADRWVAAKGRRDHQGRPVLNLYADGPNGVVMMTRDHIIPKSLGGVDDVRNLRPACQPCNETRSNDVTPEVIRFAQAHPELVDEGRIAKGLEALQRQTETLRQQDRKVKEEIARLEKPYRDMGYL